MSTLLYGGLSRKRLDTRKDDSLVFAQARGARVESIDEEAKATVGHWQDALAALVPAEVLALHAVALSLGTTSTEVDGEAATVITSPTEMVAVFWALVGLAVVLYLAGARSFKWQDLGRAAVAAAAFVLWTMIQPGSAFDAFDWDPSALIRFMIGLVGAVLLGVIAAALATKADSTQTDVPSRTGERR